MAKTTPTPAILGTGRRKTSVARVKLVPGSGIITVNARKIQDYLTVPNILGHALEPLHVTDTVKKYDISILAEGGGMNGQAGAIRLGIARALLIAMAETKPTLRAKGMLTRDSRMRERKKYGQPGARKRFQFSKR
ncbi:MAG: 30S ribosomal protein S9 [Verrucomicrobiota bacterium]|jgi:small subunit ribosomal protein S9